MHPQNIRFWCPRGSVHRKSTILQTSTRTYCYNQRKSCSDWYFIHTGLHTEIQGYWSVCSCSSDINIFMRGFCECSKVWMHNCVWPGLVLLAINKNEVLYSKINNSEHHFNIQKINYNHWTSHLHVNICTLQHIMVSQTDKHDTFTGFHESMQYYRYHLHDTVHCIKYMLHNFTIHLLHSEGLFPGHTKVLTNPIDCSRTAPWPY